jgi:hypothetical protein
MTLHNINIDGDTLMDDVNSLLQLAIKETKNLEKGETFLVRDLFKGYLWNRISRGDRLLLGSLFLSHVSNHPDSHIQVGEKGVSGQQRYRKV